jgi:hypothetical protein
MNRIRNEPFPKIVKRISEILAPNGPPKFVIVSDDESWNIAGSNGLYVTRAINIYR